MCGIAGLVRRDGLAPDDVAAVSRMTGRQIHRGPAAGDVYSDSWAALGHRRLSIIDVSALANQPMCNEDRTVWITYNGEIYNHLELRRQLIAHGHRFRSNSDTEVILHGYEQWGIERLLETLRGMFAFGLYDSRQELLLAARDRLGIKPLYYCVNEGAGLLLFASEVRALLASHYIPKTCERHALGGFLLTGSVPGPATLVKGVSSLQPGHFLTWREGRTTIRKYWDLETIPAGRSSDFAGLRSLLQDSVSHHLMSDVPLGVFLSGGVDSGALVAFATRALGSDAEPLNTLTVVFDEQEFSEAEQARSVARRFGTNHREVRVTRTEFVGELPRVLAAMDQPTNDGVNTYFVSKAAREAGLTVVLSGLGGDEVFWGYRHYRWLNYARWLGWSPSMIRKALSRGATLWGRARGRERWMRMAFLDGGASSRELYLLLRGFFPPEHVQRLLEIDRRGVDGIVEEHFETTTSSSAELSGAVAFNHLEFKRYLHDQLLRDTDVFSMAHSIEARVPFLDHVLVECAASLNAAQKVGNGINKPLLVGAVDDPLLYAAGGARKKGFSFPMDRWMKDSADDLEDMAVSGQVLNQDAVRALWKSFRAGHLHWSRAWALTVVGTTVQ
jgi:asparagine synthase (glutamine-hydrolysing)